MSVLMFLLGVLLLFTLPVVGWMGKGPFAKYAAKHKVVGLLAGGAVGFVSMAGLMIIGAIASGGPDSTGESIDAKKIAKSSGAAVAQKTNATPQKKRQTPIENAQALADAGKVVEAAKVLAKEKPSEDVRQKARPLIDNIVEASLSKETEEGIEAAASLREHWGLSSADLDTLQRLTAEVYSADLKGRKFLRTSPDALVRKVLLSPNGDELWDKNYDGRWVRWRAKYHHESTGILDLIPGKRIEGRLGNVSTFRCEGPDRGNHASQKYTAHTFDEWEKFTFEGVLSDIQKEAGSPRATLILQDCRVPE